MTRRASVVVDAARPCHTEQSAVVLRQHRGDLAQFDRAPDETVVERCNGRRRGRGRGSGADRIVRA
jgi:hypothetical protein